MEIKRKQIIPILNNISLLEKNENFSITTKYKVLKIKEILSKESQYNNLMFQDFISKYGKISENGDISIRKDKITIAQQELNDFNDQTVSIPDISFTLDELNNGNISWSILESFIPFIKD